MTHPRALLALAPLLLLAASARADDWPQWRGPERDGTWRETNVLDKFPPAGLPVRWRTPVGPGYSGPAVSAGKVFLTDRALDQAAPAQVKTQWNFRDQTAGKERVLCLDQATGKVLWTHEYPALYSVSYGSGPRATPTVHGDRVYTLGAMGDLLCLDVSTGKVVWQKSLPQDFAARTPMWGFASAALVDGDRLVIMAAGPERAVVALDRRTGALVWSSGGATEPGYSSPILATLAGRRQLIAWHPEMITGLDPETGRQLWTVPHHIREGLAIVTPAIEGNRLAVSSQYGGALALEFKPGAAEPALLWSHTTGGAPEREWKKAGFNTTLSPVLLMGRHFYGVSLYGEFCCLDANTGQRVWTTLEPTSGGTVPRERWSTVFMVRYRDTDRVYMLNEKGDLIHARLTPAAYQEISRTHLIDPDMLSQGSGGRKVLWAHPAFADRQVYVRNNHELICVDLSAGK